MNTNEKTGAKVLLPMLRSLAARRPRSLMEARRIAEYQADVLRPLLMPSGARLIQHLTDLVPVRITYVDDLPESGIAFWNHKRWNIHIRATDTPSLQRFTVLHELKHIIDHPLRRDHPELLTEQVWERVADHFAAHVLKRQPTVAAN
jgi:hypothetical protein